MYWLLLAAVMVGASPRTKAKPTPVTDGQRAEQHFQVARAAEQMSAASFKQWVQTIDSGKLDQWRDQRLFAIGEYEAALQLNPAHWGAHKRLGFMYQEAGGTLNHNQRCLLHLLAYLALKPDDPVVPQAKDVIDRQVRMFNDIQQSETRSAQGQIYGALVDRDGGCMGQFLGFVAALQQHTPRDPFNGFTAAALMKPGVFTEAENLKLAEHQFVEGLWSMSVDTAGVPNEAKMHEMENGVLRSAMFVPSYLSLVAQAHEFMAYLDKQKIAYDPRPMQMLIGEAVTQMRTTFLGGGGIGRVKDDTKKLGTVGGVTSNDLWATRDYTKPLPDYFAPAGTMPEPEKDKNQFNSLREILAMNVPGGYHFDTGEPKVWPSESRIAAADIAAAEAKKAWRLWSAVYLKRIANMLGLGDAEDVFVTDFQKVGTGEISPWVNGPLPVIRRAAESGVARLARAN